MIRHYPINDITELNKDKELSLLMIFELIMFFYFYILKIEKMKKHNVH